MITIISRMCPDRNPIRVKYESVSGFAKVVAVLENVHTYTQDGKIGRHDLAFNDKINWLS